jgi:hypothetical protein
MSPTSYQTAPPREVILAKSLVGVKLPRKIEASLTDPKARIQLLAGVRLAFCQASSWRAK